MKVKKIIFWVVLVLFVGMQFVPTTPNISKIVPKTDFIKAYAVPDNIKSILKESCYDCHSNNTHYPWYNKIQPITWFLENHIKDGKEELNFNEWDTYSNRRKYSKLKSMIGQVKDGDMPLASYTFIHRNAKLSENEKAEIINWLNHLKDSLE